MYVTYIVFQNLFSYSPEVAQRYKIHPFEMQVYSSLVKMRHNPDAETELPARFVRLPPKKGFWRISML